MNIGHLRRVEGLIASVAFQCSSVLFVLKHAEVVEWQGASGRFHVVNHIGVIHRLLCQLSACQSAGSHRDCRSLRAAKTLIISSLIGFKPRIERRSCPAALAELCDQRARGPPASASPAVDEIMASGFRSPEVGR